MSETLKKELSHVEISDIFRSNLKVENMVKSVSTIFLNSRFSSKIDYKPYFQRNYVWDIEKATYFIESVLLGTEIPPIVLFDNGNKIEVIDGRQRFETLLKFLNDEIQLASEGLRILKSFEGKKYSELPSDIQDEFGDTKIRILQCSVVNEPYLDELKEDRIKKEIFKRYNSGIIPLKKEEIQRAEFHVDEITMKLLNEFANDSVYFINLCELFLSNRQRKMKERDKRNFLTAKVRKIITLPYIPIYNYANSSNKAEDISVYYTSIVIEKDHSELLNEIRVITSMLVKIKEKLENRSIFLYDNYLFYETCYWAFSVLNTFDESMLVNLDIEKFIDFVVSQEAIDETFNLTGSHFHKSIKDRHNLLSNYFKSIYDMNFEKHLKNPIAYSHQKNKKELQINEIRLYKLNKPEPTSMTIEDILKDVEKSRFMIRPAYQRSEVTNPIKSSYLLESMMINMKIPPIFVHKREDKIFEVVDGQQRLLSIIGFLGKEYIDENGERKRSDKDKFNLKNLKILNELNGKNIDSIDEKYKNKLLDFQLEVIMIDQAINQNFDSIDLFLRLNSKPYPIGENTFEMWNSYVDKEIIMRIKNLALQYSNSVFKLNDSRMSNEELITSLIYLEYKTKIRAIDFRSVINIYIKSNRINSRIKEKSDITRMLIEDSNEKKINIQKCIDSIEIFIQKVNLLRNESEIYKIFDPVNRRKNSMTNQNYYLLWILLRNISLEKIEKNRIEIESKIGEIYIASQKYDKDKSLEDFIDKLRNIHLII